VQSTDQTTALVYADVGSTLSRRNPNTNTNISLQLDDDRVQYADLKHHQTPNPELRQKEWNSHTGMVPCIPVALPIMIAHSLYVWCRDKLDATVHPPIHNPCLLCQYS
jgi:hypothetical protein